MTDSEAKHTPSSDSFCEMYRAADALFDQLHCEDGLCISLYHRGDSTLSQPVEYLCMTGTVSGIAKDEESARIDHRFGDVELDLALIDEQIAGRQVARINLFYDSTTQAALETMGRLANRLCLAYHVPALICVKNPLHANRVLELFADLLSNETSQIDNMFAEGGLLINGRSINELLEHSGFREIGRSDIVCTPPEGFSDASLLANSLIGNYLRQVAQQANAEAQVAFFVRAYLPVRLPATITEVPVPTEQADAPFLSVVTRTQGRRIEALREVLLCLSAQSCMDFELLIMGHKMKPNACSAVQALIDDLPLWFQKKVRLIPVNEGNRSTPLNYGLRHARGHYIAFLDDDDLVFDNWVEAFRNAEGHGRILHSYAVTQNWSSITDDNGNTTLAAVGPMENQYCCDFYFIGQLNNNLCPLHTLAFPAFIYRRLGQTFDEMLDTTEDWDFLMRAYFLCGIKDLPEVTCIYRLWVDHENSHALHSDDEWDTNRIRIQKRLMNSVLMLDHQGVRDVYRLFGEVKRLERLAHIALVGESRLYLDFGEGYAQSTSLELNNELELPYFEYRVRDLDMNPTIKAMRWDPQEEGLLFLDYLDVTIHYLNAPATRLTLQTVRSNGAYVDGLMGFLISDPQLLLLEKNNLSISEVIIRGHLRSDMSDDVLLQMMQILVQPKQTNKPSPYRRVRSLLGRVRRRITGGH